MPDEPPGRQVIVGPPVDPTKLQRAKELRRAMTAAERLLWRALQVAGFQVTLPSCLTGLARGVPHPSA